MPRTVRDQFAEIPGILGRTSDLDGWHRPGENEAANRHDFAACLAEANAAAVDLLSRVSRTTTCPSAATLGLFCCWPARDLRSRQPVPVKHRRGPLAQLSRTQGLQAIVTRQEDAAPRGGGPIDARDRVPAVACRRTCRHVTLRRSGAYSRSKPRRNTRSPKAGASRAEAPRTTSHPSGEHWIPIAAATCGAVAPADE
jgi:hypothetical protein